MMAPDICPRCGRHKPCKCGGKFTLARYALILLAACGVDERAPGVGYTCTVSSGGVSEELEVCSTPWDIADEQDEIYQAHGRARDVVCTPTWRIC